MQGHAHGDASRRSRARTCRNAGDFSYNTSTNLRIASRSALPRSLCGKDHLGCISHLSGYAHSPTHPRTHAMHLQQSNSPRACECACAGTAKQNPAAYTWRNCLSSTCVRPDRVEWRSDVQFIPHRADRVRERPVFMHARPTPIEAAIPARRFCCGVSFHFLHSLLKLAIP